MRDTATTVFTELLDFVNPTTRVPSLLKWDSLLRKCSFAGTQYTVDVATQIHVIGFGKAAPTMALAAEKIFSEDLTGGLVIGPPHSKADLNRIRLIQGSHPLPDEKSAQATEELLRYVDTIPEDSLVLNMVSGGTSALLCKPADPISLAELQQVFSLLLECGASIDEINTVRKTLSDVKGGRFLQKLRGKTVIDVVISDVPDDDLKTIGSGPTIAQKISYSEAINVAEHHDFMDKLPENVRSYLLSGKDQEERENVVFSTEDIPNHVSGIISSALGVASEAEKIFTSRGYDTFLVTPVWTGLIDEFEKHIWKTFQNIVQERNSSRPLALIFFGECTVNIRGSGKGGRNQELALRMALRMKERNQPTLFMSAGTDGIDGPTDVAGAVTDQRTIDRAVEAGVDPYEYLSNNDSYHFFRNVGGHIKTGPTGNNVMDLQFLLTEEEN